MPTQRIDPKVIFASNAPAIDKPPVFSDKTKGWDVARANDGRPEIKQMNKIQQDTDLKILWLNENAVLPYDASIDYPDGVVVLKDGVLQQLNGGVWKSVVKDSIFFHNTVDAMVADESITNGKAVATKGYHNIFDDGGATYLISSTATNFSIPLSNGLHAVFSDVFDIRKF